MDTKRTLWYLRKVPFIADLGPDLLARLADRVELREAKRREVIYLPGDPGNSLFLVHGGRIKVSKVTRDGKSLTLAYCGPAELFGENTDFGTPVIESGGSSTGLRRFCEGVGENTIDIANSSRQIRDSEVEECAAPNGS